MIGIEEYHGFLRAIEWSELLVLIDIVLNELAEIVEVDFDVDVVVEEVVDVVVVVDVLIVVDVDGDVSLR